MAELWHRDVWWELIWECETLGPNERAIAYAYKRYAGRSTTSYVTDIELKKRSGLKSRDAIWRAKKALVDKGWLKEVGLLPGDDARHHRYELLFPEEFRRRQKGDDR